MARDAPTPSSVQAAAIVLILVLLAGTYGIASITHHIVTSTADETASQRARDLSFLVERSAQWVAAGVALWAFRKRRPLGRWLAAILSVYLAAKMLPSAYGAILVLLGRPDTVSSGLRFESPAEALGGLFAAALVTWGLGAIAWSLAFGEKAREYFLEGRPRDE